MRRRSLTIAACLPLVSAGCLSAAPVARTVLNQYCVGCHSAKLKTGGLSLEAIDPEHVSGHADVWEKVARKLRNGDMPPPRLPRPDAATYHVVTAELEASLDAAAAAQRKPARVPVHRLNQA